MANNQTFGDLYGHVESLLSDTSQTTLVKNLINDAYAKAAAHASLLDKGTNYQLTGANQWIYALSSDVRKIRTVRIIETDTSGTATATTSDKLVDSAASFGATLVNKVVYNVTDSTFATITAVDSSTTLTVDSDIFASGEAYQIGDGNVYPGSEVVSEEDWNILKSNQNESTSDNLQKFFIRNTNIELYPTPSTANHLLATTYSKEVAYLSDDADEPLLPNHQRVYLTYPALAFMYRKREELGMAREYDSLWRNALFEIKKYNTSETEGMTVSLNESSKIIIDDSRNTLITTSY